MFSSSVKIITCNSQVFLNCRDLYLTYKSALLSAQLDLKTPLSGNLENILSVIVVLSSVYSNLHLNDLLMCFGGMWNTFSCDGIYLK